MQEVPGSNPGAAPPTLDPISPVPHLQVAKMRQGSRKGWCTRKPSTRDDPKKLLVRPSLCPNLPPCVLRPLRRSGEAVLDGSPRVVVVQVQTVKVLGKYIMANMRKLQLFARRNILAIIRKLYDFSLFFL